MTPAEFLAMYPEFTSLGTAALTAVIAEQELAVSDTWGSRRPEILALAIAARLSDSPQGRQARHETKGRNVYAERYAEAKIGHACAFSRMG